MAETASYFNRAYFEWQAERAARSARVVVPMLLERVAVGSVVDLGCGTGAWLQVFAEHGVADVLGIDGDHVEREQLRIAEDLWLAAELSSPPELDRRFDLALCLEAAHYAPESAAAAIVRALASYAPAVYFSAAVPYQSGGPGLNHRWPRYWRDLFAREGLQCYDLLRRELWEHPDVDWWYAQNGLLFAREGSFSDVQAGPPLPLVHPQLLEHVATHGRESSVPERTWLGRLRGRTG